MEESRVEVEQWWRIEELEVRKIKGEPGWRRPGVEEIGSKGEPWWILRSGFRWEESSG